MGIFKVVFRGGGVVEVREDTKNLLFEFQQYRAKKNRGDELNPLLQGEGWFIDMDEVVAVLVDNVDRSE